MTLLLIAIQQPWWCPMCGRGMGWGWGMMILVTAAWVIALGFIIAVVWQLIVRRGSDHGRPDEAGRAEEILRKRYAGGEIDRETYQRMIDDLRHGTTG